MLTKEEEIAIIKTTTNNIDKWIDNKIEDFHYRDCEEKFSDKKIRSIVFDEFVELGEKGWRDYEIIEFDEVDNPISYKKALYYIKLFIKIS